MRLKRESNIELLRIILMILIVFGHAVSQGLLPGETEIPIVNRVLNNYLSSCARIAVDCFVVIGCWYLVDEQEAAKSMRKAVLLWTKLVFILLVVSVGCMIGFQWWDWSIIIQCFFPITSSQVWFMSCYILKLRT